MQKNILVTGGLGYIGSHLSLNLLKENYTVIIIDNLVNSSVTVLDKIIKLSNKQVSFYQTDITDLKSLDLIFKENNIYCIIHLAALKSIPESKNNKIKYYDTNVNGTINILRCMKKYKVNNFIFSSTASLYCIDNEIPFKEDSTRCSTNVYSHSKLICENILELSFLKHNFNLISLRYFNPVGNEPTGILKENLFDSNTNLVPSILKSINNNSIFNIYGSDYNTKDGTCVRDFIHVLDVTSGHISALKLIENSYINRVLFLNLGTGIGTSVLKFIKTFEKVNNIKIKYKFSNKRIEDQPISYADVSKSLEVLNWTSKYSLESMCKDSYKSNIIKY